MTNYKIDAMYEVRRLLWDELINNNVINQEDYYSDNIGDYIVPIIPVQQQPEFDQFLNGKKHIVYDKIAQSYGTDWWICDEKLLFTLYATDDRDLVEMRNLVIDVFRRMDDSARDLNEAKSTQLIKFFNSLVMDISPIGPSEELKGFYSTDVVLEIKYARITDDSGRFA